MYLLGIANLTYFIYLFIFILLILDREEGRDITLLLHLLVHSLVVSCICPDRGPNPPTWHIGMML